MAKYCSSLWVVLTAVFLTLAACGRTQPPTVDPDEALDTAAVTVLPGAPPSLTQVAVPAIPELATYVKNESAAILLGKAFFWDQQAGSDGLACASCHFQAGADNRVKNQLNPGFRGGDTTFQATAAGRAGGPNYAAKQSDFPFHKFEDPNDRNSAVVFTTNDVFSSQGSYPGKFTAWSETSQNDDCEREPIDPVFHVMGKGTRRAEPRNTPTTINAVFNFRNFWDGRASNSFNGVDPFGLRNTQATVLVNTGSGVRPTQVNLRNASLMSQGVGPAVSDIEMICNGRGFASFGRKLLPRRALALQTVHPDDSVLGAYRDAGGKGLTKTYEALVKEAFNDQYWNANDRSSVADGFTQMEDNFSLFWGVALQLYEATLISDQAPYDRWAEGESLALTSAQKRGLNLFLGKGGCVNCHKGPEFTGAASTLQAESQENGLVERMVMGDGGVALYDNAFYNIGVTPTEDDLGVGDVDPWGNPLSFARQYKRGNRVDDFRVNPCTFDVPFDAAACSWEPATLKDERTAVEGAFKVPTLRNVELTGPYFHNGGTATLRQVVEFYNRGGNFSNKEQDPDISPLGLSSKERSQLVDFLKSLTDPRVRNENAPFDHPELFVPNGHPGNQTRTQGGEFENNAIAFTEWVRLPHVGSGGRSADGLPPLQDFSQTLVNGLQLQLSRPFKLGEPPVLPEQPDRVNYVGDVISLRFSASGSVSAPILYSASGLPKGLTLSANGKLKGTFKKAGEYLVTVIAYYDGQFGAATTTFKWSVK